MTLVEAGRRRAADLAAAAAELFGTDGRVEVVEARAETLAHRPDQREQAVLVTARSFGAPPLTAEIGTGFLAVGGWLVVSEPPEPDGDRWPADALARLGFGVPVPLAEGGAHYIAIPKVDAGAGRRASGHAAPGEATGLVIARAGIGSTWNIAPNRDAAPKIVAKPVRIRASSRRG